ncbi:hypothetical protein [Lentzea sp. E54]|uniref:hypothetical protein n=1 Tax=Lentzea xerophila TaxID=3435883 RepID=UPI003DA23B74
MDADIPAPVPVEELIARRKRGRAHATDGYLDRDEVASAWPVVWNYHLVIQANEVRTRQASMTGTYGSTTWTEYNAEDVQRVADAIADGTAKVQPEWRRDTEAGRAEQQRQNEQRRRQLVRTRWFQAAIGLVLLLGVGAIVALIIIAL